MVTSQFIKQRTSVQTGPKVNGQINAKEVRLINAEGEMIGVLPTKEALKKAQESGLDLVELSPDSNPPVCKILDYGKYRYQIQKKAKEAKKKQKVIHIKEIKVRPTIDVHDYEVKIRAARKFIEEGDKVKVTLKFRGREVAHQELGMDLLKRIENDLAEVAKLEYAPRNEGKQIHMVLTPK